MFSKALLAQSNALSAVLRSQRSSPLSRAVRQVVLPGFRVSPSQATRSFSSARVLRRDDAYVTTQGRSVKPTGTVFISNLPFSVTAEELKEVFSQFGNIRAVNISYLPDGRPRGTCFVLFEKVEDAVAFVEADRQDPIYLLDRDINIQHALNASGNVPSEQLMMNRFVGQEADVLEWFKDFHNSITNIRIPRNRQTGERSGLLFIQFTDADAAARALEAVNGNVVHAGQRVHFRFARTMQSADAAPLFSRESAKGDD